MQNNLPQKDKSIELAYLDDLTGIYNRRYLYKYLSEELPKFKKLALFMIDVDGFKDINDTYGHLEGDALLVSFSKVIKDSITGNGLVTRYAGDEFVVIVPEKEKPQAVAIADTIIKNVASRPLSGKDSQRNHSITTSLGLAIYPDDAREAKELIDKADQALYSSKRMGKNRFSTSQDISREMAIFNRSMNNLSSPTFINRIDALAKIEEFINRKTGAGKAILVTGAKGIGKTRVLEQAVSCLSSAHLAFLKIKLSQQDTSRPYGALADNLEKSLANLSNTELREVSQGLEKQELAEIANLIPGLKNRFLAENLACADDLKQRRFNLFKGLVKVLKAQSNKKALFLVIDDLHLIDLASLALVYYLLQDKAVPTFLCATYLNSAEGSIAQYQDLPFVKIFLRPENRKLFSEIVLKPLSQEEAREMLVSILEGLQMPASALGLIFQLTAGNPLFIEKILRELINKGLVYFKDGLWKTGEINKNDLPQSLEEAEHARFAGLDAQTREILADAALVGDGFNLDILKQVTQTNEGQILDVIDAAHKLGLIESSGAWEAGEFQFRNRKTKEAISNFIDTLKSKGLHKRIAAVLEKYYKNNLGRVAPEILSHYQQAEATDKAAEFTKKVSEIERQLFSAEEALQLIEKLPEPEVAASVEEILEIPLSQESKKILPDAIIALRSAIESAFLYPPNNQARINYQEDAFKQLSRILAAEKSLTLNVVEGALLVNGEELERKELRSTLGIAFAQYLSGHRISSITFKAGIAAYEFSFFLDSITKDEDALNKIGGISQLLKENNVVSIKIDKVRYEKAHKVSAKFKQAKDALKEMLLRYPSLQEIVNEGTSGILKAKAKGELEEIMGSLSELIKDISQAKDGVGEKSEMILASLEAIADPLAKSEPKDWDKLKNELTKAFLSLEPQLKATLIKKDLSNINAPGAIINDIISSAGDKEIINTISDNLKENNLPFDDLSDMLKVILADTTRRQRLFPALEDELSRSGLSKQDIAILLSRDFVPEKLDIQEDNIEPLVAEMLKEFWQSRSDKRRLIIKDCENILNMLIATDKYQMLMKIMPGISNILDKEIPMEEYSLIASLIAEAVKGLIYKGNYPAAKTLIAELKAREDSNLGAEEKKIIQNAFNNIVNTRIKGSLVSVFDKEATYNEADFLNIVVELGSASLEPLVRILEEEDTAKDPFELYVRRRKVAVVLKKIGQKAIDKLKNRLLAVDSPAAKNIVEMLGYMEDKSVVSFFSEIINRMNTPAREELALTLKRLWGKDSLKLLTVLLKDKDQKVRNRAGAVLLEMADKTDIPDLEQCLSDKEIKENIQGILEQVKNKYLNPS